MKRLIFYWAAFTFLPALASLDAVHAAVISRDWKTPGDGLLTYDDANKREWLDLSQTILSSQFPGADPSPHVTRENRYQYVLGQTSSGGLFEGFVIAQALDAEALAVSAGINPAIDGHPNAAAANNLAQLLGFTYDRAGGLRLSIGILDEPLVDNLIRPAAIVDATPHQAGFLVSTAHFQLDAFPGVMLFREIPEPTAFILAIFSSLIVIIRGRALCLRVQLNNRRGPKTPFVRASARTGAVSRLGVPNLSHGCWKTIEQLRASHDGTTRRESFISGYQADSGQAICGRRACLGSGV